MNICILSDCNNNCSFCFQKEYHKKHLILSYEEIEDIIKWGQEEPINILGGEPTLHPDIIRVMHRLAERSRQNPSANTPGLISNILGETEIFKELSKIKRLAILVNTNYPEHLKDRYHNNFSELMNRLLFIRIGRELAVSITLTGVDEQDSLYINKLFETLALYNRIIKGVRIGICVPSIGASNYKLVNHDEMFRYIVNRINNEYKGIYCTFDCLPNNCQISYQLKCELQNNKYFSPCDCFCTKPIVEILPDKSVSYCFPCPDELKVKNYKLFKNVHECRYWYKQNIGNYVSQAKSYCQINGKKPDCDFCDGCCLTINECFKK